MKYRITHTTRYQYSSPVSVCHNVLMLEPRHSPGLTRDSYRLDVRPYPKSLSSRVDMFGNVVHRFSLEENHSVLKITSTCEATVHSRKLPPLESSPTCGAVISFCRDQVDPGWLDVSPFFFDSPRIRRSTEFAEYAQDILRDDRPILEAALDLTQTIYSGFKYDKDATRVDTPTETAFSGKHGVCQDFAHIAVACMRSCGLPARYVSGYLRTIPSPGAKRLVGNDQSHAWFSVYCGSEIGWVDFDPTNNSVCGADHVPVAHGRDYSDVVPVKGIFLGGGKTTMTISVDVAPTDQTANEPTTT